MSKSKPEPTEPTKPPDDVQPWEVPYFRLPSRIAKLRRCNGVAVDSSMKLVLVKLYSNARRLRDLDLSDPARLAIDLGTWPSTVNRVLNSLETAGLIRRKLRYHPSNEKQHPGGFSRSEITLIDGTLICDDSKLDSLTGDVIAKREWWHETCRAAAAKRATRTVGMGRPSKDKPRRARRERDDEASWPTVDDHPDRNVTDILDRDIGQAASDILSQDIGGEGGDIANRDIERYPDSQGGDISIPISRSKISTKKSAETRCIEDKIRIDEDGISREGSSEEKPQAGNRKNSARADECFDETADPNVTEVNLLEHARNKLTRQAATATSGETWSGLGAESWNDDGRPVPGEGETEGSPTYVLRYARWKLGCRPVGEYVEKPEPCADATTAPITVREPENDSDAVQEPLQFRSARKPETAL